MSKPTPTSPYQLRSNAELTAKFGAMGITLTNDPQRIDDDIDILNAAVNALNGIPVPSGVPTIAHWNPQNPDPTNTPFSFGTITETQFQPLFNLLVDDATAALIAKIGQPTFSALAGSNEMVALLSMTFNSPTLIGPKLVTALQTGNRAEAWYEIRYQSNKEQLTAPNLANGIANRRYAESDLFNLYENTQTAEPEAKSIYRMYTAHRETILRYEQNFPPSAATSRTFQLESFVARNLLLTTYAQFAGPPSIDGEILVGSAFRDTFDLQPVSIPGVPSSVFDLSKNDLMLGEGGDDFLRGRGGSDVLYGGAGFDTYVYATGNGHDRIEDSDATT